MKPGLLSTEFWVSLAAAVIGAIMALGYVPADFPNAEVIAAIEKIVGAAILIYTTVNYTKKRTEIKKTNGKDE